MDLLINAANLLFVLGFFTMDLVRLRLLSVAGTSCLVLYFAGQPEPLLNVVAWNLVFIGLNLVQLVRLLRSHRTLGGPARVATTSADVTRAPDKQVRGVAAKDEQDVPARPLVAATDAIASFA